MISQVDWSNRFLKLAQFVSTWSKDPSTKCGAVIVRFGRTIASVGYNGFPRGYDDDPSIYENRELKYSRVVHAEMNAILNCTERPQGYSLFIWAPGWGICDRCAAHAIQAGIIRVVYPAIKIEERALVSVNRALMLLHEAQVTYEEIEGVWK